MLDWYRNIHTHCITSQQTRDNEPMLISCWTSVIEPTLSESIMMGSDLLCSFKHNLFALRRSFFLREPQARNAYGCCTTQQAQNICITFVQRRPNVFDVGPALYKCYTNVLWMLYYTSQCYITCQDQSGELGMNLPPRIPACLKF